MKRIEFIEHVREIGGFEHAEDAEGAVIATFEALAAALLPEERRSLTERLPKELRTLVASPEHRPYLALDAFFERVERHERTRPGRAREHAHIVCRALTEVLDSEALALLRHHLPQLESLFSASVDGPLAPAPETLRTPPRDYSTLAAGRPGSRHPLAEAHPTRAHAHSVARSVDPHADTKLSSSHGLTQERENETLASGKPGSKRPLSG